MEIVDKTKFTFLSSILNNLKGLTANVTFPAFARQALGHEAALPYARKLFPPDGADKQDPFQKLPSPHYGHWTNICLGYASCVTVAVFGEQSRIAMPVEKNFRGSNGHLDKRGLDEREFTVVQGLSSIKASKFCAFEL